LKTETLASISIPVIPQDAQMRVINHLNAAQESVNQMQEIVAKNSSLLQQVEQAILNEAFRGEL